MGTVAGAAREAMKNTEEFKTRALLYKYPIFIIIIYAEHTVQMSVRFVGLDLQGNLVVKQVDATKIRRASYNNYLYFARKVRGSRLV